MHGFTMHASASHSSFFTWIKVAFRGGRRLAHLLGAGPGRTAPATWSTPRRGACVARASGSSNASSGLLGTPTGGKGKDGRIHNDSSRHSTAAQREVASLFLYIGRHHFLCISTFCWRGRVSHGPRDHSFIAPSSLARRRLARVIHHHPFCFFVCAGSEAQKAQRATTPCFAKRHPRSRFFVSGIWELV